MVDKDVKDTNIKKENNFKVNAFETVGRVKYDKLIEEFGTQKISKELIDRFAKATNKDLHPWLKRGIFFSHRDFDKFLTAYENGEPVFLYTGRGPSSDAMHIGHLIPFMFTKWLQDAFDCPLVIQISDEEKAAWKKGSFQQIYNMGFENAKDIVACEFNPKKTFIFSNRDYRFNCNKYEEFVYNLKLNASMKDVIKVFGLSEDANVNMLDWPFYQSAASFSQAFPHIFKGRPAYCLIPCAIDQDPYFRLGRDLASKMNLLKTTCIYCTFLPPLTGLDGGKMSSSVGKDATLFLTDDPKVTASKIKSFAKSGSKGSGSLEDHKMLGGDTEEDIAYQYLRYFEFNDEELEKLEDGFKKGIITCSEMKNKLIDKLVPLFKKVRDKRENISNEYLQEFYKIKPIELPKVKEKEQTKEQKEIEDYISTLDFKSKIENENKLVTTYHIVPKLDNDYLELKARLEGTMTRVKILYYKENYYMLILNFNTIFGSDKNKLLANKLNIKKLSFATKETVQKIINCELSYCSLFCLYYDKDNKKIKEILIDKDIPKNEKINFNPIRNDATVTIYYDDMIKFINNLGYIIKEVSLNN